MKIQVFFAFFNIFSLKMFVHENISHIFATKFRLENAPAQPKRQKSPLDFLPNTTLFYKT